MTEYRPYDLTDTELLKAGMAVGILMNCIEATFHASIMKPEERRCCWQLLEKKVSEQAGLYEAGAVVTASADFTE